MVSLLPRAKQLPKDYKKPHRCKIMGREVKTILEEHQEYRKIERTLRGEHQRSLPDSEMLLSGTTMRTLATVSIIGKQIGQLQLRKRLPISA